MPLSDKDVRRAAEGDRDAQRAIYEELVGSIHRVIGRIVGDSDADDVTQIAMMRLFEKLPQFRGDSRLSTWAHRLAVNEALQHRRRRQRQPSRSVRDDDATTAAATGAMETTEMLQTALRELDPELRLIFELKELEEWAYDRIADTLEIPVGTVGSRLNRARRELREILRRLGWDG